MEKKADCYKCKFRRHFFTEDSSCCLNKAANVMNHAKSVVEDAANFWPFYFFPAELSSCDGFVEK